MARSLYILLIYVAILGIGAGAPFLLTLGYVWVDIFRPQDVAWSLLQDKPVAAIMGAAAIGSYLFFDRQSPPRLTAMTVIIVVFALWVTATTYSAIANPLVAWWKWDWAFKTIVFTALLGSVLWTVRPARVERAPLVVMLGLVTAGLPLALAATTGSLPVRVGLFALSGVADGPLFGAFGPMGMDGSVTPRAEMASRLTVRHFDGGHMFYVWEASRLELTAAIAQFVADALAPQ